MPKVYYKRLVEGITVPAVIHNMHYYYLSMPVFEDGTLDCWKRISLGELEQQLAHNWLVTAVPEGKTLSIHGLGSYRVRRAEWKYTPQTYAAFIRRCVQQMNREMVGLFEETPEQKQRWEAHQVQWSTHATPYKLMGEYDYEMVDGASVNLLYQTQGGWVLTAITAYGDGALVLDATGQALTLVEVQAMFACGTLGSGPEGEITFAIPEFAKITATAEEATSPDAKYREIQDALAKVAGGETSLELCRRLYQEYLVYPTQDNRERLRKAYEAVPEHQRIYLGDMDTRDEDYIRILYHPDDKRQV